MAKGAEADADVGGKKFTCGIAKCGQQFDTEVEIDKHLATQHRIFTRQGGNVMREGTQQMEPFNTSETNPGGWQVGGAKPIDEMDALRRILFNNGVRDRRESIIELFEYEDPKNYEALKKILAMAEVSPRKQDLIVSLWSRYMDQMEGKPTDSVTSEKEDIRKKLAKNPMDIRAGDMIDWTAADYGTYMLQMQKYMQAQQMQTKMLEQMFTSMGMSESRPNSKIPPEVQAQLDRLKTYEEQERMKQVIEPIVKELRYMRAEQDEKKGTKSPFEDMVEMAKMKQMMESLNSKEGAEMFRLQMEERLEKLRMEQQREMRDAQAKQELLKNDNQVLQLKTMEAAFGAKLDIVKAQLDVANTTKKDDLLSTLKQAQEITAAMKGLTGDQETPEDKKMRAISDIISSAAETLKPVAAAIGEGMMNKNRMGPQQQMPQNYGPPQRYAPPTANIPFVPPGKSVIATCPTEGCGAEFQIDPTMPDCECPNCHTHYNVQPMRGPAPSPGPGMPSLGSNPGNMMARKQALLGLPDQELAAAAIQLNINPMMYQSKEQLVDEMLKARF
jgi:hypothetical protein